ncbi:head-tail connector protein [Tautonia marina]|uniref:head-tail connector protein n=1 Tax=Tautonia marina TaxID=2653855 RepID=UPI001260CEE3|nr:head-tail connector protein [Tautonia marina]
MLRQSLALVTPPASEPVSLSEAKAWARIDGSDDDATLTALITAARLAAEQYLRRSLITQTWKLTLDLCGARGSEPWWDGVVDGPLNSLYGGLPNTIPLPRGPVSAISSVVTYDLDNSSATYSASNYRLDNSGDRLILNYGAIWPANIRPKAGCEITYTAGYGSAATAVPQPIKQGILIHVASLYEQRGNCEDAMALPPGTAMLYSPYRIMGDRLG